MQGRGECCLYVDMKILAIYQRHCFACGLKKVLLNADYFPLLIGLQIPVREELI